LRENSEAKREAHASHTLPGRYTVLDHRARRDGTVDELPRWEAPVTEVINVTEVLRDADVEVAFTNSCASTGRDLD
jgi:hypothetical protein